MNQGKFYFGWSLASNGHILKLCSRQRNSCFMRHHLESFYRLKIVLREINAWNLWCLQEVKPRGLLLGWARFESIVIIGTLLLLVQSLERGHHIHLKPAAFQVTWYPLHQKLGMSDPNCLNFFPALSLWLNWRSSTSSLLLSHIMVLWMLSLPLFWCCRCLDRWPNKVGTIRTSCHFTFHPNLGLECTLLGTVELCIISHTGFTYIVFAIMMVL